MNPKKLDESKYSTATRLIYGKSFTEAWDYGHHVVPPMTKSTTFRLESAKRGAEGFGAIGNKFPDDPNHDQVYVYDRMGEPNNNMLQHALAIAEQKEVALTFASGMGAVSAAICFALNQGSEIISHTTVYGCTYSLFNTWMPKFGHKVHYCNLVTADSFLPLVNENTRLLYLESPANPTLDMLDLEAIMQLVRQINLNREKDRQIITVMDNTFATPYCQRPGNYGVDVVVHSLTKGICGFGTAMGGAVITEREYLPKLTSFKKDFGAVLSPDSAWHILTYGISTLAIRMRKQQENAARIANFLEDHSEIETVLYPGLKSFPQFEVAKRMMRDYDGNFAPGMMIYFTVKGKNAKEAKKRGEFIMDYLAQNAYCITLAVSLGQTRTLIEHPGSMTHAAYSAEEQIKRGINPGGIRLAVGIEDAGDIIKDLDSAFSAMKKS
jgi:methionine-gamma-lyase